MQTMQSYITQPLTRAEVDALPGVTLLEFGTPWCGHCQIAQPMLEQALAAQPPMRHLKIEDGKGRALGRSFGIKQWPTVVLLLDGNEIARVTRPSSVKAIAEMLAKQSATPPITLPINAATP